MLYGQSSKIATEKYFFTVTKRIFDLVFGLVVFLAALPVMVFIAVVLSVIFMGNPFYTQRRGITLSGRLFKIIKFRTMVAPNPEESSQRNFLNKTISKSGIPQFCALLRKTGLDELPQIFNVLLGDMSFVGPRPLSVIDLQTIQNLYNEEYSQRLRVTSKPGITGYWQVYGDRHRGVENLVSLELQYEQLKSLWLDVHIILKTIPIMVSANHSDAILGKKEKFDSPIVQFGKITKEQF